MYTTLLYSHFRWGALCTQYERKRFKPDLGSFKKIELYTGNKLARVHQILVSTLVKENCEAINVFKTRR